MGGVGALLRPVARVSIILPRYCPGQPLLARPAGPSAERPPQVPAVPGAS